MPAYEAFHGVSAVSGPGPARSLQLVRAIEMARQGLGQVGLSHSVDPGQHGDREALFDPRQNPWVPERRAAVASQGILDSQIQSRVHFLENLIEIVAINLREFTIFQRF